jgi:hypothetical protein
MTTPRNLSEALKQGFEIKKILYANSKNCRVDLQRRNFQSDAVNFVAFWMNTKLLKTRLGVSEFERRNYTY